MVCGTLYENLKKVGQHQFSNIGFLKINYALSNKKKRSFACNMSQTFTKEERLISKNLFEQLFSEGKQLKIFPLRLLYIKTALDTKYPAQVALTAPKRLIKKAVHRNKIKRQMREAYRKNKQTLYDQLSDNYVFIITFMDTKEWKTTDIELKMKILLEKLISTINENNQQLLN